MKLKTLKDIRIVGDSGNNGYLFEQGDLKAEAIKWVKEINTFIVRKNSAKRTRLVEWIKMFFNITEDDLKIVKDLK